MLQFVPFGIELVYQTFISAPDDTIFSKAVFKFWWSGCVSGVFLSRSAMRRLYLGILWTGIIRRLSNETVLADLSNSSNYRKKVSNTMSFLSKKPMHL